jgi:hypothetical protein
MIGGAELDNNLIAMNQSKIVYSKLKKMFDTGDRNLDNYLKELGDYVTLKSKNGSAERGIKTEFSLNDKTYTMSNMINFDHDYIRFAEDASMMVYRLNGGEEIPNTYELIDHIKANDIQITKQMIGGSEVKEEVIFYKVGIIIPSFCDQKYLRDRDRDVIATSQEEAIQIYKEEYAFKYFLNDNEKKAVQRGEIKIEII